MSGETWPSDEVKDYHITSRPPVGGVGPAEPTGLQVPPVYRGGPQTGPTSVDTAALKHFAAAMRGLDGPVQEAINQLNQVDPRAGAFPHASELVKQLGATTNDAVDGTTGLRKAYLTNIVKLQTGLRNLASGMDEVAARYESTEQANSSGAADIAKLVDAVARQMSTASVPPTGDIRT